MSNFLVGVLAGFFLCIWALGANPIVAAVALVDRIRQVEVSFAAEAEKDQSPEEEPVSAEGPF